MSFIDIIIIIVAIVAIVYGYAKGVISQLGSLLGIIVGIIVCRLFANPVAKMFAGENATESERYVTGLIAMIVLFIAAYIIVKLLSKALKTVTHSLKLSIFDRIAGAAFAIFEWLLVVSILLNVWQAFAPNKSIASNGKLANGALVENVMKFGPDVLGSKLVVGMLNDLNNAVNEADHKINSHD